MYAAPTVADFKTQFYRDFPYLPLWNVDVHYNTDEKVYYDTTRLFYQCLNDDVTSVPTTILDWAKYTDRVDNYISDTDITKAITEAGFNLNTALFETEAQYQISYLYMAAHYLCNDIQASAQGINSQYNWLVSSKSVGSVSQSFGIPDKVLKDPYLSYFCTTRYGMKYLSLVLLQLRGNISIAYGTTQP